MPLRSIDLAGRIVARHTAEDLHAETQAPRLAPPPPSHLVAYLATPDPDRPILN